MRDGGGKDGDPDPMREMADRPNDGEANVSKDVDCRVFEDQLDSLVRGTLPDQGKSQISHHANECPDCAMQLRVQEHLLGPTLAELEAQVPEDLVGTVWAGVEEGMGKGKTEGITRPFPRPRFGSAIPALAAASLILLFSTGFLIRALGHAQDREALLAQQVSEQQRWLGELEVGAGVDPVARTAALAGRDVWMRALSRQESITLRGLQTLLQRMPGDRAVLSRTQLDSLLQSRVPVSFRFLQEALGRYGSSEEVTARELLEALDNLDEDDDLTVPTAELVALLS